jgi:hypothetical protein
MTDALTSSHPALGFGIFISPISAAIFREALRDSVFEKVKQLESQS